MKNIIEKTLEPIFWSQYDGEFAALPLQLSLLNELKVVADKLELELCAKWHPKRVLCFLAGRYLLRELIFRKTDKLVSAILINERGAPTFSSAKNYKFSISHKNNCAVVYLANKEDARTFVGIDLEDSQRKDILKLQTYILAPEESEAFERKSRKFRKEMCQENELLLAFSLKEAVYKVLDPVQQRYIGFHEVIMSISLSGCAEISYNLKAGEEPQKMELFWQRVRFSSEDYFLSFARADFKEKL